MTCGFQIRCFVFSATLSAYPAASAAFLSLRPLSFPNKNSRCMLVRPFRRSVAPENLEMSEQMWLILAS